MDHAQSIHRGPTVTPILGRLVDLRLRRMLTQAEVARAIGTSQPRIAERERGRPMTSATAAKMAAFFGVPIERIVWQCPNLALN